MTDLEDLTRRICAFRDERDWRQFHTLRQLIVSLNLEAAELLELTQWRSDAEIDALPADPAAREELCDEMADVLMYLLLAADMAGIDLAEAVRGKLVKNARKYPVERARGNRDKYSALSGAPAEGE
jgi:NTP pyrophosphatase (non-canonical NTP hydrolase)